MAHRNTRKQITVWYDGHEKGVWIVSRDLIDLDDDCSWIVSTTLDVCGGRHAAERQALDVGREEELPVYVMGPGGPNDLTRIDLAN